MQNLDFGKLTTIVLIAFIIFFFFGGEISYWFEHKNDLKFSPSKIIYTKQEFDEMDEKEQTAALEEIKSICVRKHFTDNLSCDDTAYWLANSLEEEGVEAELAIAWMPACTEACETRKKPVMLDDRPGKRSGI